MNKIKNILFPIGATAILAGLILKIAEVEYALYVFAVGSLLVIMHQILLASTLINTANSQNNSILHRQHRLGIFSSLFLAIAVYFMYINSNSWIVMLLIYAITTLYLSFRIKQE